MTREEQITLLRAIKSSYNVLAILRSIGIDLNGFTDAPTDIGTHLWANISSLSDMLEKSFELDKEKDEDFIGNLDEELCSGTNSPEEVYQMIRLYQQVRI